MNAQQLIDKNAIRTKPCNLSSKEQNSINPLLIGVVSQTATCYDYSYCRDPIFIAAATESHILFKRSNGSPFGDNDRIHVLDNRWCDDNWTDYDELLKLAEPNIQKMMQSINTLFEEKK